MRDFLQFFLLEIPKMSVVDKFSPWVRELETIQTTIEKLNSLTLLMHDNEILFSEDELSMVQKLHDQEQNRYNALKQNLDTTMEMYEKHVLAAREILKERMRLLNNFEKTTGLLSTRDDIMKTFVEGQSKMETQIRLIEGQLFKVDIQSQPKMSTEAAEEREVCQARTPSEPRVATDRNASG